MSSQEQIIQIDELVDDHIKKYMKYEDTVVVTGLIKIILNSSIIKCNDKCICIGTKLKRKKNGSCNGDLSPDIHASIDCLGSKDKIGLAFEMKWDVSGNFDTSSKEINDLKRYFDTLNGFPDMQDSDNHNVFLVANRDDAFGLAAVADQLNKDEPIGYGYIASNRFAIVSWDRVRGKDGQEKYRVEKVFGKSNELKVENCLQNQKVTTIKMVDVAQWRAKVVAVADEPPRVYLALQILRALKNLFQDPRVQEYSMTEEQIMQYLNRSFPRLTPSSSSQFSESAVRAALQDLVSLKYNVIISAVNTNPKLTEYKILNKSPSSNKDLARWLAEKFEKKQSKKAKGGKSKLTPLKRKPVKVKAGKMRTLDKF